MEVSGKMKENSLCAQFPAGLIHPWTVIYTDWSFSDDSASRSEERCVVTAPSLGDCVMLLNVSVLTWSRPRAKQKRRVRDWPLGLCVNDEREVARGQETDKIRMVKPNTFLTFGWTGKKKATCRTMYVWDKHLPVGSKVHLTRSRLVAVSV